MALATAASAANATLDFAIRCVVITGCDQLRYLDKLRAILRSRP
jgi:hypothetical protein